MANIYIDWSSEFNPYQNFASLGDANRSATGWVVPNFTHDSNSFAAGGVPTLTVFGGENLTYDAVTGLPNGGTITSIALLVLDYGSSQFNATPPVVVFQPLQTITGVEIDAATLAGKIAAVATLFDAVGWMEFIDHDDPVIAASNSSHIIVENLDGTFTEVIGTNLAIGPGGISGQVSTIKLLDTDAQGRAELSSLSIDTVLGLPLGSTADAAMVGAALFDGEGEYFFKQFNEGDGIVTAVANGFFNFIGDTFFTDIIDGAGSDTIINDTGNMGVSYSLSGPILASLGDFDGIVSAGPDIDMLVNVRRLWGSEGNDVINARAGTLNFMLRGNDGNDTIFGGAGNDYIGGDAGNDVMDGGAGIDRVSFASSAAGVTVSLAVTGDQAGADGTDRLVNFEELEGSQHADNLTGNSGNNFINGNDGIDTMTGGAGDDVYVVDQDGEAVNENAGEGTDEVRVKGGISGISLAENVENLTLYGESESENFVVDGTGNALDNIIRGNAGVNELMGLLGNDTYYVQNAGDTVIEAAGEGGDKIYSSVSFTISANVETLELTGTANINATGSESGEALIGNAGSNTIIANGGNDVLFGGVDGAADTLNGGAGNDSYIVIAPNDVVMESSGEGTDTVRYFGGGTYVLGTNVEKLELKGGAASNGNGNSLRNSITGNINANVLTGFGGNDTLLGLGGNDRLIGGAGNDMLYGGAGDDVFVIADANDALDATFETSGNGIDTVESGISWTLSANIEKLTLTGAAAINGTGNAMANTIDGASNSAANTLKGMGGNDLYFVGAGDIVDETSSGSSGNDAVQTALLSYTLTAGVEILQFTGSGNFVGTGNALANGIFGGAGADVLDGAGGADNLSGFAGDDIYVVDNAGDVVNENAGEGTDTVASAVNWTLGDNFENLTLAGAGGVTGTGNALANVLTGSSIANTLIGLGGNDVLRGLAGADNLQGGDANDTLYGGAGNDTLSGGAGSDVFVFDTTPNATTNKDTIADFNVAADTIQLENAVFAAIVGTGTLTAAQFRVGTAALDADDRIIYNSTTGALIYDSNGNVAGGAIQFAMLAAGLALTNADFVIV